MKEKRIASVTTLFASLSGYFLARASGKDPVPIVMICGFFGSIIGEKIAKSLTENDQDKNPPSATT